MTEDPTIWHYGLMAERWAEVLKDAPEVEFLKNKIESYGEPVLDVACGTGRLLLPLARAGYEIDGLEFSADMLGHCRRLAASENLQPQLYLQSMAAMNVSKAYRLIYIIGSFGLAGSQQQDLETLRRCHQNLAPGGALVLNIQAEYTDADYWSKWATERLGELPDPWPEQARDKEAEDGSIHRAYFRVVDLDPLEQRYTRQVRLEKWVEGERVASEEYSLSGRMYLASEVRLMLEVAGFDEIHMTGDYSEAAATAEHDEIIFTAVK